MYQLTCFMTKPPKLCPMKMILEGNVAYQESAGFLQTHERYVMATCTGPRSISSKLSNVSA